jgi:arsenate reductase-like glutaredoxin family protein
MEIPIIYLDGVWLFYFEDRRRLRCTDEKEAEGVVRPEKLVRRPVLIAGRVLVSIR